MLIILFIITSVVSQEIPTPAAFLGPNNFNYHPYQIQFLKEVKPTKQGPVLFPNDGPPPPKTPLVVTSRPLLESIARSDLTNNSAQSHNQNPTNNELFDQNLQNIPEGYNNIEYQASSYRGIPYNINTARIGFVGDNRYEYEDRAVFLPIYKVLEDKLSQNLLDIQTKPVNYNYQAKPVYYTNQYENDVPAPDENRNTQHDQDQYKNYAFSYTVKDKKTGDDFSHSQHSSGSATNGEYRVRLPDGRTQIVSYIADENGYKANVRYDDENTASTNYYNANYNNNYNDNAYYDNRAINNNNNVNAKSKQIIPVKEEDYNSREDYYDYSSEYNNYQPYKSKFNFNPVSTTILIPTVRPYEINELVTRVTPKPLYTDLLTGSNNQVKYDSTTEKVVIGKKNVYNLVTTPKPVFVGSTPASYLASTIAALRERITAKPPLSNNFIDRITKYLNLK